MKLLQLLTASVLTTACGLQADEEVPITPETVSEVYVTAINSKKGTYRGIWLQWFREDGKRNAWTSYYTENDRGCFHPVYKRSADIGTCQRLVNRAIDAAKKNGRIVDSHDPAEPKKGVFYTLEIVAPPLHLRWDVDAESRRGLPEELQEIIRCGERAMPELQRFDKFDRPAMPAKR